MSLDKELPSQLSWDDMGDEWKAAPAETPVALPPQKNSLDKLKGACGRAFTCVCGAGGGFLTSHIGCLVSPALAFAGVAGSASISAISLGASAVITAGGLGFWYVMRGMTATRLEKTLTVAGALTGAVMAASLHLTGVMGGHDHHSMTMDEALDWYRGMPEASQVEIRDLAETAGMPLNEYIFQLCGAPLEEAAQSIPSGPRPRL